MDIGTPEQRERLVRHLVAQGAVDPERIPPDIVRIVHRDLRLCDLHWRFASDDDLRLWACAWATAQRFRERLRAA